MSWMNGYISYTTMDVITYPRRTQCVCVFGGGGDWLNTPGLMLSNMMTSSNGDIFRVTGHLCGEFTGPGELPTQRPVTRSFDVFFDLRLNKRLSKQSWGWWFETPSRPITRHRNDMPQYAIQIGCYNGTSLVFIDVHWRKTTCVCR